LGILQKKFEKNHQKYRMLPKENLQFGQLSPIDARFFGDGHQ
jgi:hypothetical protein